MNHVRYKSARLCLWLCLSALAAFPVAAQNTIAQNAGIWAAVSGNSTTMGMGANGAIALSGATVQGAPLAGQAAVNLSGWTPAGNYGVSPGATGVSVGSTANMPLSGGRTAPVSVSSTIKPSSLGPVFLKTAKLVPFLNTGVAIYDLFKEVGYDAAKNADGSLTIRQVDPSVCSVAPCYVYQHGGVVKTVPELTAICEAGRITASAATWIWLVYPSGSVATASCRFLSSQGSNFGTLSFIGLSVAPSQAVYLASSEQALSDAIAAKSGWPVSTSTKADEAVKSALDLGQTFEVNNPVVTGPSSVTGPSTTSTTPAQNGQPQKVTTESKVWNLTYNTNTVNISEVTNTSVNDGVTTTTTSKVADVVTLDDPCKLNPDRAGCVKLGTPESDPLTKKVTPVSVTSINFASSSACPAPLSFTVRGATYGVSYQPLCDRLFILKALFLAMAGFLAAYILADSFKVA